MSKSIVTFKAGVSSKVFHSLLQKIFTMLVGNWIKRLRITKDIKQATVARRLGISQQAYSKLENSDRIGKQRLTAILKAMDSTEEELTEVSKLFTPPPLKKMSRASFVLLPN